MPLENNFDPECFDVSGDRMCNDPECRKQIAAYHSITEERFWYSVTKETPLRSYEGAVLAAIQEWVEQAPCGNKACVMEDGAIALELPNPVARYSIPFLRGVFDQKPLKIEVFGGIHAHTGEADRLLRVTFNGVVKFYDLSDSQP